jgi:hypothetical protein
MKRRILALFSVLPLGSFPSPACSGLVVLLAPVDRIGRHPRRRRLYSTRGGPVEPGDSTLFLGNRPDMTVCKICRSAYALGALHSVRCTPCFRKTGFRVFH